MPKPSKKAYSLEEAAIEWTKRFNDAITVDDVVGYARDGAVRLHVHIVGQRFNVINAHDFSAHPDIVANDGTTWINGLYVEISNPEFFSKLLSDETFELGEIQIPISELGVIAKVRHESGAISVSKKSLFILHNEKLKFEQSTAAKPITTVERNTLLTIIAALCDYSDIEHQGRGASTQISNMTDEIGAHVDDGTIRKWLKLIPDALESRRK